MAQDRSSSYPGPRTELSKGPKHKPTLIAGLASISSFFPLLEENLAMLVML